jgi:hypothetical protein
MRIVFAALMVLVSVIQEPRAQSEIHLIPRGYTGWVAVAFRAPNGEPATHEGAARLYRIPASGVLLTQAEPNRGVSPAWKFYFEDTSGARTEIRLLSGGPVSDTQVK